MEKTIVVETNDDLEKIAEIYKNAIDREVRREFKKWQAEL